MLRNEGRREQLFILLMITSRGREAAVLFASVGVSVISGMARHLLYRQVLGAVNLAKLRSLQRFRRLKFGRLSADVFAVMIDDLDHLVSSAVSSVFGTMLNLSVAEEAEGAPMTAGEPHLAGSVGFIGIVTGVVFVYSTVS